MMKKALSALVLLTTLFVVNSVSAESPVASAYAHPATECRTSFGAQVSEWLGAFGISVTLPPSGDCKHLMDSEQQRKLSFMYVDAGDLTSFVETSLQANRYMRRIQTVETARRDYMPRPLPTPQEEEPVDLSVNALFAFDKADISFKDMNKLAQFADSIAGKEHDLLIIEGHTDERGSFAYNEDLGMRRAAALKTALVGLGVDAEKIQIVSYGENYPVVKTSTEEAWQQNRHASVSTTVYPKEVEIPVVSQATAKAKYDAYNAEMYLADYEADLADFEALTHEPLDAEEQLDDIRKDISGAKVRIEYANFRKSHNKLSHQLTVEEGLYWANKLYRGGEDLLANQLANHFNFEFEEGEFIVTS